MNDNIIGRRQEMRILDDIMASHRAELAVVYGRRRVGKTFLIKNYFDNKFDFYTTGIYQGTKKEQLDFFIEQLRQYSGMCYPRVSSWFDAFTQLKKYLSTLNKERIVVFLDELPWLDTQKSRFLQAFEAFWNSWAADQPNLKVIICGSATTWVISKLFGAKGGLYNRVTRKLKLKPFCLGECELFLNSRGFQWNRNQIIETYMVFGGIPYYLDLLPHDRSLPQAIDSLFFSESAELNGEFQFLFKSLFKDSTAYRRTIEILSSKAKGLTRNEIQSALKLSDGGRLTEILGNLEACDFIRKYYAFGKKERDAIFQLSDLFSLFYLHHVKGREGRNTNNWTLGINEGEYNAWTGYAFEQVCFHHLTQIRMSLGINGVISDAVSWSCKPSSEHGGAQIDLLIRRNDGMANLCEMKYCKDKFTIEKAYEETMLNRAEIFRKVTDRKYAPLLTMITPKGIKKNIHSGCIHSEITSDALFHIPL